MDDLEKKTDTSRGGTAKKILKVFIAVIVVFVVLSVIATALVPVVMFGRADGGTGFNLIYSEEDARDYPRERFTFVKEFILPPLTVLSPAMVRVAE